MSIAELKETLGDHARDLKINLSNIGTTEGLAPTRLWGTALACAVATRHAGLIRAVQSDASEHLDEAHVRAAKGAASLMAMTNVYYRFLHLVDDDEYVRMPARLRMQLLGNPGIDKVDFEYFCLAVSILIGCPSCIRSHEKTVREGGVDKPSVQAAARIAAIMSGVTVALDAT